MCLCYSSLNFLVSSSFCTGLHRYWTSHVRVEPFYSTEWSREGRTYSLEVLFCSEIPYGFKDSFCMLVSGVSRVICRVSLGSVIPHPSYWCAMPRDVSGQEDELLVLYLVNAVRSDTNWRGRSVCCWCFCRCLGRWNFVKCRPFTSTAWLISLRDVQ